MRQHSKLQLHVLNLYKKFLRASARHSPSVKEDIQESFRKLSKDISKSDTFLIEYHVRRAERQLRQLESSNISGVSKIRIQSASREEEVSNSTINSEQIKGDKHQ